MILKGAFLRLYAHGRAGCQAEECCGSARYMAGDAAAKAATQRTVESGAATVRPKDVQGCLPGPSNRGFFGHPLTSKRAIYGHLFKVLVYSGPDRNGIRYHF